MSHSTNISRWASAVGASGLMILALAAPAAARPDPGTGGLHERTTTAQEDRQCTGSAAGTGTGTVMEVFRVVDDNAMEYFQIGAGTLAGLALAGAGAMLVSRRNHAHANLV